MKVHSLTPSEVNFVDATPVQALNLVVYEAEPGDGWGSPFGGFIVARDGWHGDGSLPGLPRLNRGAALAAWCEDRQKTFA